MLSRVKFFTISSMLLALLITQPSRAALLDCRALFPSQGVSLQYDPNTYSGSQIDHEKKEEWVAAHHEDYRQAARLLADNIKRFSLVEFQEKLRLNFRSYLKTKKAGERFVIVIIPEGVYTRRPHEPTEWKSNGWVSDYLLRAFPEEKIQVVNLLDVESFIKDESSAGRDVNNIRWVLPDDAAYSGQQMSFYASVLNKKLVANNATAGSDKKPVIDLVVPFSTSLAREKTSADGLATLYSQNTMPLVKEIDREKILPVEFNSQVTLTFFQHKLPDYLSFSDEIAEGRLIEPGRSRTIKFIERDQPPYKQKKHYNNRFQRPIGEPVMLGY